MRAWVIVSKTSWSSNGHNCCTSLRGERFSWPWLPLTGGKSCGWKAQIVKITQSCLNWVKANCTISRPFQPPGLGTGHSQHYTGGPDGDKKLDLINILMIPQSYLTPNHQITSSRGLILVVNCRGERTNPGAPHKIEVVGWISLSPLPHEHWLELMLDEGGECNMVLPHQTPRAGLEGYHDIWY